MSLPSLFVQSQVVNRLGVALVHFIWQGSLIAALLALILPLLHNRSRARYAACWVALVLMASAVPLTVWLLPAGPAPEPRVERAGPTAARRDRFARDFIVPAPGTSRRAPEQQPATPAPEPSLQKEANLPAGPGETSRVMARPSAAAIWQPMRPWVVGVWLSGVVILACWRLCGWIKLRAICERGTRPVSRELQERFDRLVERLHLGRAVRLLETSAVSVPAVFGWLRPVILVPVGLVTSTAPGELDMILMHELAHIRRHDFLANLVQVAIETCLFYHPVVWWVSRCLRAERECCCDELVVAATGERLGYARALAQVAEQCGQAGSSRWALAASGGSLLARIRRLLGVPAPRHRWLLPQVMGGFAVLGLAICLAGYVVLAAQPAPAAAPQAQAAQPKKVQAGEAPAIVSVFPADGATAVKPTTEIRIRFDRPMNPHRTMLEWDMRGHAGFRPRGDLKYDRDKHEFTLPVYLTPGQKHKVQVNREGFPDPNKPQGFQSAEGVAAAISSWSFTTAGRAGQAGAQPPRITAVSPADDSEAALITILQLTFDQPMDPESYGLALPGSVDFTRLPGPTLLGPAHYDADVHRFSLTLQLPPNWYGELRLEGFRGTNGALAEPMTMKLRTLRKLTTDSQRTRIEQAMQSATLKQLIDRVRVASKAITSVSEEVTWTRLIGVRVPDWSHHLETEGSLFKKQGERQFVGNVDEMMNIAFRVGSDGQRCWLVREDELITAPFGEIAGKNVVCCDPFDASGDSTTEQLIEKLKLEYLGETIVREKRCHWIRSWDIRVMDGSFVMPMKDWYIDSGTLLPVRFQDLGHGMMDFTYDRINERIPDQEFQPQPGPGIAEQKLEPLEEGYTRRTLNVIDGSNGRMSVRWGMEGPKGRKSSGLN